MKRREFIALVGGAAATWPVAVLAQQPERVRRIGVLMSQVANDANSLAQMGAFTQALQQLGWTDGRNGDRRCPCNRAVALGTALRVVHRFNTTTEEIPLRVGSNDGASTGEGTCRV